MFYVCVCNQIWLTLIFLYLLQAPFAGLLISHSHLSSSPLNSKYTVRENERGELMAVFFTTPALLRQNSILIQINSARTNSCVCDEQYTSPRLCSIAKSQVKKILISFDSRSLPLSGGCENQKNTTYPQLSVLLQLTGHWTSLCSLSLSHFLIENKLFTSFGEQIERKREGHSSLIEIFAGIFFHSRESAQLLDMASLGHSPNSKVAKKLYDVFFSIK